MGLRILHIDAFTDRPFAGNPAAVCFLPAPHEDRWMQAVASEMNLSETAFLLREGDVFRLRWFTPAVEVDLCGHATLASGHFLWEEGHLPLERPAIFHTRSGVLTATRRGAMIELDFPALPTVEAPAPDGLLAALGATPRFVGKSRFDYLVELENEIAVRELRPNFALLEKVTARGIIVTARGSTPYDFISRFFAPQAGVNEDPVTGSAHCALGPYWAQRLRKSEFTAFQASRRGGVVQVSVAGERVKLAGSAVTVMRGELCDI